MDMSKALDRVFEKYNSFTDEIMGLSFLREPFCEEFRGSVMLEDDAAFVKAFDAFMRIANETFSWNDYLDARTTAEKTFRAFYTQQHYPDGEQETQLNKFIISFFNQRIDECQFEWEDAHPGEEMPEAPEDDIDNLYLSRVFAVIPYKAEDEAFCRSIGVRYHYEQLHMCSWFSGQITNGEGHYSRDEINYSARTTYNRLLNPYSLLWIGVVMGADKAELKAAAEEMAGKRTNAAKCGTVRKHVPFDEILQLYRKLMTAPEE